MRNGWGLFFGESLDDAVFVFGQIQMTIALDGR